MKLSREDIARLPMSDAARQLLQDRETRRWRRILVCVICMIGIVELIRFIAMEVI